MMSVSRIAGRSASALALILASIALSVLASAQTPNPADSDRVVPTGAAVAQAPGLRTGSQDANQTPPARQALPTNLAAALPNGGAAATTPAAPPANAPSKTNAAPAINVTCERNITADVVAFDQPYMFNRLGAARPGGPGSVGHLSSRSTMPSPSVSLSGQPLFSFGPASLGHLSLSSGMPSLSVSLIRTGGGGGGPASWPPKVKPRLSMNSPSGE